ncbi:MAG: ABC transporter substrate-binding protein, partial [Deltaproteobacteria bacterium]
MRILLITIFILWFSLANALEVVDQKNRTIQFDNPVNRVVSIPIPAPSMFMSIDGSADKLVGVHQLTKTAMKGRFLGRLFPEVLQLPSDFVGGGFNFMPNVERV